MGATLAEQTRIPGTDAHAGRVRTHEGPVRLTRRGQIVVTMAVLLLIGALSIALASAAQATRHEGTGTGAASATGAGKYVTKVTVGPGQSLWSIAESYDPQADTRLVIQDILEMNSLTGDQVQPGQVLWIPRE